MNEELTEYDRLMKEAYDYVEDSPVETPDIFDIIDFIEDNLN